MLETQMLCNPNLVAADTNCLEKVQEIEQYYIKDGKLYCYGLDDTKLVRDEKRKLKTYVFEIDKDKDTIVKAKNKKNTIFLCIVNLIIFLLGILLAVGAKQLEIGLFMIFFICIVNVTMIKMDNKLYHKCQEFYALHKEEIKSYND